MIEFYSKLKEEYVLAFINTDKGWLAFCYPSWMKYINLLSSVLSF